MSHCMYCLNQSSAGCEFCMPHNYHDTKDSVVSVFPSPSICTECTKKNHEINKMVEDIQKIRDQFLIAYNEMHKLVLLYAKLENKLEM